MRLAGLATILILAAACSPAATAQRPAVVPTPADAPAALPHTHQFSLHSKILDRDFEIYVAEPVERDSRGKAAVVYALDGNSSFGMVEEIARSLQNAGEITSAYIVGVGYGTGPNRRDHDYLHETLEDVPGSGGGAGFERFLLEEVKPLIEARYHTDPARSILAGHSFGGLFTANVLVRHPEAFSGWLISSGSLWARDEAVVKAAQRSSTSGRGRGARVYLSVGEQEGPVMADPIRRFGEALSAKGSGFMVVHRVWEGETHVSVPAMAYSRGLRTLLAPPRFGTEAAPAR